MTLRDQLFSLADPNYKAFQEKLLPKDCQLIGVRLPKLRQLAKDLAKQDFENHLSNAPEDYFEEILLKGMLIGSLDPEKIGLERILSFTDSFLPKIDNWSVCDSFCAGLKLPKTAPDALWHYLQEKKDSTEAFTLRFVLVMFLFYYLDDQHYPTLLIYFGSIRHENYYVKMAVAWAIATGYVLFPKETTLFLSENRLEVFTHNKAIQKIRDSKQVSADAKASLLHLKRKNP